MLDRTAPWAASGPSSANGTAWPSPLQSCCLRDNSSCHRAVSRLWQASAVPFLCAVRQPGLHSLLHSRLSAMREHAEKFSSVPAASERSLWSLTCCCKSQYPSLHQTHNPEGHANICRRKPVTFLPAYLHLTLHRLEGIIKPAEGRLHVKIYDLTKPDVVLCTRLPPRACFLAQDHP